MCLDMVRVLLEDRLGEMSWVEYVGVLNSSGKSRGDTHAPPFVFSTEGQLLNFQEERHHTVRQPLLVPVLTTTKAANEVLEGWKRIINTKNLLIHSNFEVYLDRHRNHLVYVKDRCQPATVVSAPSHQLPAEHPILLHVIRADVDDLPDDRKGYESDNLNFHFNHRRIGLRFGGLRLAVRNIPAYDTASIHTGEYTDENPLWRADVGFNE